MKPSIALPHNRLPNAPTPEFSRHILAPHPVPLHTQISQTSLLPFKPVRLLCVPLAAPSGSRRLRSVLPSQHSPATTGRSTFTALRRHPAKALTAPCRPLSVPRNPGPTSSCLPARTLQCPSAYVHDPHPLLCASPDPCRLTFPIPAPNTSSSVPRVHGSTFHLPLDLLSSDSFLTSDPSQPPKPVTAHTQQTRLSHSCHRIALSTSPASSSGRHALPSASSPM